MAAAFDLGMMLNTAPSANMVQQIACDLLTPYHNHMFALMMEKDWKTWWKVSAKTECLHL